MSPTRGLFQIVNVVHIKALNIQIDVFEVNRAERTNNHGLSRMVNPAILGKPHQICAKVGHRVEGVKCLLIEVREKLLVKLRETMNVDLVPSFER